MNDLPERPDLSRLPEAVQAYIMALEERLAGLKRPASARLAQKVDLSGEPSATSELPSTAMIITVSVAGLAKRTPRYLYSRQGRGGMGVFDIDLPEDDQPALIVAADLADTVLVFTRDGRAYRLAASALAERTVRAKGEALSEHIPLGAHDRVVALLPEGRGGMIALVSQRGWVRRIRPSYLGPSLIPGTVFHDQKEGGPLVAACWTSGDDDLFIATLDGKGIRFNEMQVPGRGCLGIRLDPSDTAVAVTSVAADGQVFLLGEDGRGTIREMVGFAANRAPGASGKLAMKTNRLVAAVAVDPADDMMILSRLSKVIRFDAASVPPKSGVVQGVNCMTLRADEAVAVLVTEAGSR